MKNECQEHRTTKVLEISLTRCCETERFPRGRASQNIRIENASQIREASSSTTSRVVEGMCGLTFEDILETDVPVTAGVPLRRGNAVRLV